VITVSKSGLERLGDDVRRFGDKANLAAQLSINDTVRWARTRLKVGMQQQVNLTESAFGKKHFFISQLASRDNLQATLSAGRQGYSLSRFSVGKPVARARGIKLRIKAGGASVTVKRGFFIAAPNGALGLAVRTSNEGLRNSRAARRIGKNLYLLFGPSPDQLMRRMAPESVPDVGRHVGAEYSRQLNRLLANG